MIIYSVPNSKAKGMGSRRKEGHSIMLSKEAQSMLEKNGWKKVILGYKRSSDNKMNEKKDFQVYVKSTKFDSFLKNESDEASDNPHVQKMCEVGSNTPMGTHSPDLTPSSRLHENDKLQLPEISNFSHYPSLMAARLEKPSLLIAFDSEWENTPSGRSMLSWQYAIIYNGFIHEIIFIKSGTKDLELYTVLGFILDYLEFTPVELRSIRRYEYCTGWKDKKPITVITSNVTEARSSCIFVYRPDDGFTTEKIINLQNKNSNHCEKDWIGFRKFHDYSLVEKIPVTMVCHTGKVDLSTYRTDEARNILRFLHEVQGGLVSMRPLRQNPRSLINPQNSSIYPLLLSISDTMCHAPAGKKRLADLGKTVGVEKIVIPQSDKENMLNLLQRDPVTFFKYASTDSIVTLLYASALYGYNKQMPVTITSASSSVMKETMMEYLKCNNDKDFNRKYRGLEIQKHGKVKTENRAGFIENSSLEPISDRTNTVQHFASHAFHGGYNSCSEVGYFPELTYDYDLKNAYPTSMCLVPDIDWEDPIKFEIKDKDLNIRLWSGIGGFNPLIPFVGYVRFEFPDTVKFPCIPVNVDGVPVYPLSSDGLNGVYTAGPYIFLALKLGAKVYCETGYFLNTLYTEDGVESRSLAHAVKGLVVDREHAKIDLRKGCLEELILKAMVNSGFGKVAQNVIPKQTWSAYKDHMEDLGCSGITQPVSAMIITSLVQCELLAAQNMAFDLGYMTCSVTTDGFISNVPLSVLISLDLYGFRHFLEQARLFLTDGKDPELWEIKHVQDDLVNFSTRGNVSLHDLDVETMLGKNPIDYDGKLYPGVCAHNSTKSPFPSDSYEDRLWLMTNVLNRKGTVNYTEKQWTTFKELTMGKKFQTTDSVIHKSMDFDLKRKPDRNSFTTDQPVINGEEYEIAHYDTIPFNTLEEYRMYRLKHKLVTCLRTVSDWSLYWSKVDLMGCGAKPRDIEWSILFSCIMGYRSKLWDIPALNNLTVEEKCAWITKHNTSQHKNVFTKDDWKNANRPKRQVNMLPKELLQEKLDELTSD